MWWCCGKREKDQPGCKFQKHLTKEDEDEKMESDEQEDENLKYTRCQCCKELGHRIDNCFRDPNLRTRERDADLEFDRIKQIKDFRKLHADTMVSTTHMLKKAVTIPVEQDEFGEVTERENA